jgi:hypothetical protein
MDDGEDGGAHHVGLPGLQASQQDSQEQPAEQGFFDQRDDDRGRNRQGHRTPRGVCAQGIKTARDQKDFAQQNRQSGEEKANDDVTEPAAVRFEAEVTAVPDPSPTEERPEKNQRAEKERSMKIRFEIEIGEAGENSVGREALARPKQSWGDERAEKNRGNEIGD